MISLILPARDADTIALDFGVFVAEHARTFRTSHTAIIAALLPSIIPSQPPTPAPAAPTSTNAPVDVQAESVDAALSADPLPETANENGPEPDAATSIDSETIVQGGIPVRPGVGLVDLTVGGDQSGTAATESTGASQKRAQTATGTGTVGDNPGPASRPMATAKTDAPTDRSQASGDGQSQDDSGVRVAPVDTPFDHHSAAPATSPVKPTDPQAKHAAEGSLSSEPGGMQDESAIHPATPSKPRKALKPTPKAQTTRARVRELNAAHPDWGHRQICSALPDANPQTISVELSKIRGEQRVIEDAETQQRLIAEAREREKAPAPGLGEKQTLNDKVRALHHQHPNWTARLIAIELGANPNSVSVALARIRNPKSLPTTAAKPEFAGRRQMVEHYGAIAKRLGKPS